MLVFQDKLPSTNYNAIVSKINSVASNLNIDPNWLMLVMNFESRLNPRAVNPISGATGLIQFMPATAISLGTTVAQLKQMPFEDQLYYVEKYYTTWKSRISSFIDLYLATFFPKAMGKPDDYVLETSTLPANIIATQNPIFDPFKTGKVTVGAIKKVMLARVPAAYLTNIATTPTGLGLGFIGLLLFGFILYKNV